MPAVSVASPRPDSRRTVRLVAVLAGLLTFVGLLLVAGPASAHDQLLSSDPKDGATLDEPPTSIALTFSAAPLDTGIEVALVGPDGTTAAGEDIQVDDEVVTAQLDDGLPAGDYTVAWHVVSSDGHPIDGELTYTVKESAPVDEPTDEPTDGASDEPEMTTQEADPAPEATEATAATDASTPSELAGDGNGSGASGIAVAGGILAAVLVVLGVVVIMRRKILENDRLRQAKEQDPEDPDTDDGRGTEHGNQNPDPKGGPRS